MLSEKRNIKSAMSAMVRMPRSSIVRMVMLIVNYHQSAICAMVGMPCAVVRIFH